MHAALSMILLLAIPSVWGVSGWLGIDKQRAGVQERTHRFTLYSTQVLLLTLLTLGGWLAYDSLPQASGQWLKLTPLSLIVSCLIVFIGSLLLRFSKHYLAGDLAYPQFYRWMLLTLSAVAVTVNANHLLLFWFGWVAISLCLHRLLVLYPGRKRAQLAAHKKFILARLAESCLLAAFALLYYQYDTFFIDALLANIASGALSSMALAWPAHLAAWLLALAALIKCAQLPLHGWLVGVIESPTPTSALLHAGIINLGGYLLIVFAPLVSHSPVAQWTLLIVAGGSIGLAALVMVCQVSVKEKLAWSTCAQMGLMLVECALGLFALALMHLVLHSLYKAFAFLSAGNAVNERQLLRLQAPPPRYIWRQEVLMALVMLALLAAYVLLGGDGAVSPWLLLTVALCYFVHYARLETFTQIVTVVVQVLLALLLYGGMKMAVTAYFLRYAITSVAHFDALDIAFTAMILVLVVHVELRERYPQWRYVKRLNAWLQTCGYLDEYVDRLLLKVFPMQSDTSKEPSC